METGKLIISFIITCIILAGVSNLITSSNIDLGGFTIFVIIGILAVGFTASYFIVDKIFTETNKAKNSVIEKVKEHKELNNIKKETDFELQKYTEARHSFKYLSKDLLVNIYNQKEHLTQMELLGLEEELVERGILDYSPMHEKIHLMRKEWLK